MPQRIVLDTTAFLAALPLMLYDAILYTTPSVVEEVRDAESRSRLETALVLERVRVVAPRWRYKRLVLREATRLGLHTSLSNTDLDVAALALQLRSEEGGVSVVTDDYALQNLLGHLHIEWRPLRTRGISRVEEYIVICPVCGYKSEKPGEKVCPVCGTPLRRQRLSSSSPRRR